MSIPASAGSVTGLDVLSVIVNNPGQVPVLFTDAGRMFKESPVGSGTLVEITANANIGPAFPLSAYMQDALAYNRMYQAFSDGKKGIFPPLVIDGPSGKLSFVGQNPIGAQWTQGLYYRLGDLVRALDGRWWRCTIGGGKLSGPNPPVWPTLNGYFSSGPTFVPAVAVDPVGGSQWEEWTPACAQYLPAPQIGNLITHAPGTGTIAVGKDVYIKLAYTPGTGTPLPESPRSVAAVFVNTSANDAITISSTNGASTGGIPMPRWVAEILLDPLRFAGTTLQLNVYVAAVATGAAAPADSVYIFYGAANVQNAVQVTSIPVVAGPVAQLGCPIVYSGIPGPAPVFFGQGGTRYMIILRENQNSSLSPVDPGSAISVNLVGQIQQQVISLVRDSSGNVKATVGDITGIAVGQGVTVQGCQQDATFNGSFKITNVQGTLTPEGILSWKDAAHLSASNANTGEVILPAGPPPVAFLPPGGINDLQDIAAFTVAAPQAGQAVQLQAGPYTYIPASIPNKNFTTQILSMQGPITLALVITTLQRFAGGQVSCTVPDISGVVVGMTAVIADQGDASFNGSYPIQAVIPGTGTVGTIQWTQSDTATGGPGGGGSLLTIQSGTLGQVQATVADPSGLAAGSIVNITAPVNVGTGFTGPTVLASVIGNVVTFPSPATGAGPGVGSGASMTVMQELPTVSSAATVATMPTITSISRDANGNVIAIVPALLGYAAGQVVQIVNVSDASFNALVELVSATLNADGVTATLTWVQAGLGASNPTGGNILTNPFGGGFVGGIAMLLNFDDNVLSNGVDVTKQLTAMVPPNSLDVYYCETLDRMIYTTGIDSQHYVSNLQDAENIDQLGGILSVATANSQKTICVREMLSGEIISMKERGGYAIEPNNLAPNQWGESKRWDKHGPVNPKAVGVGSDFLVILVQYSGLYRYHRGDLTWISREKQGTWDRVNWNYKHTIWCEVDEDNNNIRIGLPLDGATTPNKEVILNYFNGWEEPLTENFQGQVIPNRRGRRWTENDLLATSGKIVNRAITVDSRINARQMLYGLSYTGNGFILADIEVPDRYFDDGAPLVGGSGYAQVGIDWQYQPAFAQSETLDQIRFVKMKGRMLGSGSINFTPVTEDPSAQIPAVTVLQKSSSTPKKFQKGFKVPTDVEMLSFNINNGAQPGVWTQLQAFIFGGNEVYPGVPTE